MAFPLFAPRPRAADSAHEDVPVNVKLPRIMGPGATHARGREAVALLLWMSAMFITLALASYGTGTNWVGPVGEACAGGLVWLVGVVAWALPIEAALLGVPFVRGKDSLITPARVAGDLLIAIVAAALVQVGWPGRLAFSGHIAAGAVGELFGEVARSLFSTIGSFLVGFACIGLILISRASFSFIALMRWLARFGAKGAAGTAKGARNVAEAWKTARELEREEQEKARIARLPKIDEVDDAALALVSAPELDAGSDADSDPLSDPVSVSVSAPVAAAVSDPDSESAPVLSVLPPPAKEAKDIDLQDVLAATPRTKAAKPDEEASKPKPKREKKKPAPLTIVDTSAALEKEKPTRAEKAVPATAGATKKWKLPDIEFLVPAGVETTLAVDKEALYRDAELLEKTLADYGVSGKVEEVLPGPTVTTFEVSTAAGTKVSKVAGLADDLALALARKVRIVAPIPGKNRIGFELPNKTRIPVNLRDLVEDRRFQALSVPLPVALGRDIQGHPVYADLASMPHVIVAGATGAGKSVGLNVMLASLLYRRTPDELRMLMIDPKVVELAPFDRIPHMLLPVVTDMKQAATALKWAVDEMERRYQLFADAGTKNIATFNNWVDRVRRGEVKNPAAKTVLAKDPNGFIDEVKGESGSDEGVAPLPERLPSIVIVVDEFADLMMQQGKDVEAAVARLAQKARAAGMHVILATQRPSVDVITGMIKANFPTRVAFRVAQKVDSRTILDEQGAEHLLGRGDMLIKLNGTNETKRVQCPMVTEEEVQAITDFLRLQGEPVYDENILKPREDEEGGDDEEMEKDSMYDEAVRVVADTHRCSTSWLQRKLGLGYNRAARIVEMMERQGIVGPANGSKDREVLVSPQ
ncbi:MAG TPA: DNA translocase FtsK [Polyangiaceae bacterium]|nr:DNA translocase FtsK [Polyangiaceae bacterium]